MADVDLQHTTTIDAAPADVWAALVDVAAWDEWNPTLFAVEAPLIPGTTVRMKLRLGRLTVPMRQRVKVVDAPQRLVWTTINGFPGAMDVDREFILVPEGDGTRLIQQESATGPLSPVLMPLLRARIVAGYEAIAEALRERVAG